MRLTTNERCTNHRTKGKGVFAAGRFAPEARVEGSQVQAAARPRLGHIRCPVARTGGCARNCPVLRTPSVPAVVLISIQGPRASRLPLATFSTRLQRAQSRSKLTPQICSTPNKTVTLDTGEQIAIMPRLGKISPIVCLIPRLAAIMLSTEI
jgi:hypothetical protein